MESPLKLVLVRHAITAGNLAGQYIGRTDQALCQEGIESAQAAAQTMPPVARVYCSPMLRCRQTAEILYPQHIAHAVVDLRETDFGRFEGKTHAQLVADPDYRAWIASAGVLPPPDGESTAHFSKRCVATLIGILDEMTRSHISSAACVIHGGSIMVVMAALASPKRSFYDWRTANCGGFIVNAAPQSGQLTLLEELRIKCEA